MITGGVLQFFVVIQVTENNFLNVKEAAIYCRVHVNTIKRWISQDRLRATKAGRKWVISKDNINLFLTGDNEATEGKSL